MSSVSHSALKYEVTWSGCSMVRLAVTLNEFPDETFEFAFESLEERKDMFLLMLETGRESQTDPAAECGRTLQGSILL